MNALGLTLLGTIAHATAFAFVGAILYVALRRSSPAAGALAAGSSLLIMAIVSACSFGPWPRWYTFAAPGVAATAPAPVSNEDPRVPVRLPESDVSSGRSPDAAAVRVNSTDRSEAVRSSQTFTYAVLREFSLAVTAPAAAQQPSRWGWPEWLAVGFFISLFVGFARLGLGLLAVARLRSRSGTLDDATLLEEIQLLRAELSCTRTVEVRESWELQTPATVGWRTPLILLPCDWRDWSSPELRAVLAHELAHVRRGDFLTGSIAQLSVALHFYHPMAHWLAKRLRLEQEMAADAWGAALCGGGATYLVTLAHMALKREDRGLAGPARAFLPSRGTLVTRIEMLRNTKVFRTGVLPARARTAMIGLLASIGLAVAGLRGPTGQAQSLTPAPSGADPQVSPERGPRGNTSPLDLSLLPAETKMLIVLRPAALLDRNEIRALVRDMHQGALAKAPLVIAPEEIAQLACFWEGLPEAPGVPGRSPFIPPPSGIIVRSTKAQDWKGRLTDQFGSAQEFRLAGQPCLRLGHPPIPGWCAFTSDDRTVVLSGEDTLHDLIQDRRAPAPRRAWDEAWEKSADGQVIAALETRWLRRRLAQAAPSSGTDAPSPFGVKFDTIAPLLEQTRAYVISLDATRGIHLDVRAVTGGGDDAHAVAATMQAVMTLARNSVESLLRDADGRRLGEAMKGALSAAGSVLSQARIETTANIVHLRATTATELTDLAKMVAPAMTTARAAARRTMSVNNLKQIGLAFHNYASANGHFPSPALLGGEQKKFPYSWRVAILPYLEQEPLYRQYHFDEPWDGPNNRKLIDQMPAIFSATGPDGTPASRSNSSYYVFAGEAAALGSPSVPGGKTAEPTLNLITDGLSNTILAVEWQGNVPWTKPDDIPFDPNGAVPALGGFSADGFDALFCDGSVRAIKKQIDPNTLKALITRAGGEVLQAEIPAAEQILPPRTRR